MITLPTEPSPESLRLNARHAVAITQSPYTGHSQAHAHPGRWWELEISLGEMHRDWAEAWIAAFIQLAAGETFVWGPRAVTDVDFAPPRGSITAVTISADTPTNAGVLYIDDGDFSPDGSSGGGISNWAIGDYLGIGGTLQKVLGPPTWNGSESRYELPVFPGLRTALSVDTAAELDNPTATFRLTAPAIDFFHHHYYGQDPITMAAVEAF
ncbi:hypothetical protein [Cerasicoccus arenae]|uniref:Uncharacterized protein n=1 Tax=Cerasicoccus arenae TaxID=424488 RepID=A0A8J3DBV3_9BACT|nr:hypothetical protein [Cerasicoccus arenae]MBK1858249.1 hypothetical protein [Cerasicoccus arenae]GHC02157.1 hypothetical protein GCM10007047_18350 [Cerasicoccus arenae]